MIKENSFTKTINKFIINHILKIYSYVFILDLEFEKPNIFTH